MDAPIIMPRIFKRRVTNRQETLGGEIGYPDGSNSFLAGTIVVLTGGNLIAVATDGVLACGICPDASKASATIDPPTQLFGDRHWPFNLHGLQFLMNIGTLSGTAAVVGEANTAKQLSDVTIGETYAMARATTSTYAGYQFLDPTDTSNDLLTVIDKPTHIAGLVSQDADTYNALVLVEINADLIQSIG